MTVADKVRIRDDSEVEVTSAMGGTALHRFSYWRAARRFAWGIAHANQLAVTEEDRHGWAISWGYTPPAAEGK